MKFLRINSFDQIDKWHLVQEFLSKAGTSLETFRYFLKRNSSALEDHLHTVLLYENKNVIGYGHLDKCEAGNIWLGICLVPDKTGKGIGKLIMNNLINYSDLIDNKEIRLSVDISNVGGKKLYEHFGFKVYNTSDTMYYMKRSKNV